MSGNAQVKIASKTRKNWLKDLKLEIMELRYQGLQDNVIKKNMHKKFREYSSATELFVGFVFFIVLINLVGFGLHIGYAVLMWEAHIYEFSTSFSPYVSMLIFGVLCIVLVGLFIFWLHFFIDFLKFYKTLDDALEEQFYLKLIKMFLLLGLIGFVVFMIMVFFVGMQIAEVYGMPLGSSLYEILGEIFD
ncbi:hypothetical protein [Helicobacter sp. UBA3407]|uniref:hypothetical protein n=1 Tax=Helicobacter sp. UBA3407 TaxID=1946588 RepID=UPI002611FB3F|nr:hypothetical protein [Helicobacter sp. UBA3407]